MVDVNREQITDGKELLRDIKRRISGATSPVAKVETEDAIKGVMCTLSQHLSGGEARHLFYALPRDLHPLVERCMIERDERAERFGRDQFMVRVADQLDVSLTEAERISQSVLRAISSRLPPTQVLEVAAQLPRELRDLWSERTGEPAVEPHPIFLEIEKSVPLPRGVKGARALAVVACTLTKRLSRGEARHLVDSLPHETRPLLERCVTERGEDPEHFDAQKFLQRVGTELNADNPEQVARAVFKAVQRFIHTKVVDHVRSQLPKDLAELWVKP
jgi:uncharacterized protein (DUF2267 family)